MAILRGIVNVALGKAEIREIPHPELPDDHVKVRPTAWAINPDAIDHLVQEGDESCAGCSVGVDYAGVVVEVGPRVSRNFKVGDRIVGVVPGQNILRKTDGAFSESIVAKGDVQMKVPDNISDVDAATQGVALVTMGVSLYRTLELPLPEQSPSQRFTIFIYGGSTAMGISAIQLAKLSGGTVITTASPSNLEYIKSLGGDHVLDYKSTTIVDDVLRLSGSPLLYAFDTYPDDASAAICAAVLSRGGGAKYVSLIPGIESAVKRLNDAVDATSILGYSALGEPYVFDNEVCDFSPGDYEFQKKFVKAAEKLLEEGKLKAPRVFLDRGGNGLEGVLHGLEEIREGRVRGGKLVYTSKQTEQRESGTE